MGISDESIATQNAWLTQTGWNVSISVSQRALGRRFVSSSAVIVCGFF